MHPALFVARVFATWFLFLMFIWIVWTQGIGAPLWIVMLPSFFILAAMTAQAMAHVHRVRLIAGDAAGVSLGARHRRQVEVPFPAEEAFDMVDGAIRELPHLETVESSRDSLQVHARVLRLRPYRRVENAKKKTRRNLVHAIVAPGERTASVTLACEPDGGPLRDWLVPDNGTNLENVEAIVRALRRRIGERRKGEEAQVRESAAERELSEAKLSLLHAQVEPHFLYNTLASAQVLTRTDPPRADQMLGNLITYLRRSLPRTEAAMSTLGEELERTRAYLEILKIRMGERLAVQIQVAPSLESVPLPPMMLQTLAENAIKHGLEPLPGGGNVWITARLASGQVSITVADDGRGFNEDGAGTGIGLRNVRERLRLAYGEAASLAIMANFPKGVAATITVPFAGPAKDEAHA